MVIFHSYVNVYQAGYIPIFRFSSSKSIESYFPLRKIDRRVEGESRWFFLISQFSMCEYPTKSFISIKSIQHQQLCRSLHLNGSLNGFLNIVKYQWYISDTGWWFQPLWKMMEFVSWDNYSIKIPTEWKVIIQHVPKHQEIYLCSISDISQIYHCSNR